MTKNKTLKIALAGNPNSGKTTLFNALTGSSRHVANYPGITVEYFEGEGIFCGRKVKVIDLPGTYSLTAYSPEEIVARNFILQEKPDLIINVLDAGNLERNLYLTIQLIELDVPLLLALNMVDSAEDRGITVDHKRLSEIFGIRAQPTAAKTGRGIDELKSAAIETMEKESKHNDITFPHPVNDIILKLDEEIRKSQINCAEMPPRALALKLLEDDPIVTEMLKKDSRSEKIFTELEKAKNFIETHSGDDSRTAVVEAYYSVAAGACRECIRMSEAKKRFLSDTIDKIACNRFFGPILLFLIVYLLFSAVFMISDDLKWIPLLDGRFVSPTESLEFFFEHLKNIATAKIANPFLQRMVTDGIISGVGGVLSFVPLIFFMFLIIAAIEDTGYMARIAFILDRILRIFGLQGKSILPLLLTGGIGGGGCAVPGILTARTMREEKDRLVTILVTPMMNCGAKLPVYAMLIAAFFSNARSQMMFLLWVLSWIFTLTSALFLRKFIIKGEQTPFVMELPVYHMPTLRGVLMHSLQRTWMYVKKAGTIILAINLLLWLAMTFPQTNEENPAENLKNSIAGRIGSLIEPISSLAGFKWRENIALIGGFAAKEVVVSTLGTAYAITNVEPDNSESLSEKLAGEKDWNKVRAFALMVFVMLYSPCLATVITIRKETASWKWALFSTIYSTILAFIIAAIIFQTGSAISGIR